MGFPSQVGDSTEVVIADSKKIGAIVLVIVPHPGELMVKEYCPRSVGTELNTLPDCVVLINPLGPVFT